MKEKNNRIIFIIIVAIAIICVLFAPVIVERVLFALGNRFALTTVFEPNQVLAYMSAIFPLFATIIFSWLLLKQNQNLNDINEKLQKQNMRISQDSLINASFNFLDIESVKFEIVGPVSRGYSMDSGLQKKINFIYQDPPITNSSDYDMKMEFYANSFSDIPIREIEIEMLNFEFDISMQKGNRTITEKFCMEHGSVSVVQVKKAKKYESVEYDYVFAIYLYIPRYYMSLQILNEYIKGLVNAKIHLESSHVNMLNVRVKLSHKLYLTKSRRDYVYLIKDHQVEFKDMDIK